MSGTTGASPAPSPPPPSSGGDAATGCLAIDDCAECTAEWGCVWCSGDDGELGHGVCVDGDTNGPDSGALAELRAAAEEAREAAENATTTTTTATSATTTATTTATTAGTGATTGGASTTAGGAATTGAGASATTAGGSSTATTGAATPTGTTTGATTTTAGTTTAAAAATATTGAGGASTTASSSSTALATTTGSSTTASTTMARREFYQPPPAQQEFRAQQPQPRTPVWLAPVGGAVFAMGPGGGGRLVSAGVTPNLEYNPDYTCSSWYASQCYMKGDLLGVQNSEALAAGILLLLLCCCCFGICFLIYKCCCYTASEDSVFGDAEDGYYKRPRNDEADAAARQEALRALVRQGPGGANEPVARATSDQGVTVTPAGAHDTRAGAAAAAVISTTVTPTTAARALVARREQEAMERRLAEVSAADDDGADDDSFGSFDSDDGWSDRSLTRTPSFGSQEDGYPRTPPLALDFGDSSSDDSGVAGGGGGGGGDVPMTRYMATATDTAMGEAYTPPLSRRNMTTSIHNRPSFYDLDFGDDLVNQSIHPEYRPPTLN